GPAGFLSHCCPQCTVPPPAPCQDCGCPCDQCRLPSLFGCAHAHQLIDGLHASTCCERIRAAKKLGSRLHADFCTTPEVLPALIGALQCDPCWEVRSAAGWSILMQNARPDQGVLALYIASRLDPHCLVRDRAAEALDILTLGRKECFRDLLQQGDALVKELK